jgi:hypothetical protein
MTMTISTFSVGRSLVVGVVRSSSVKMKLNLKLFPRFLHCKSGRENEKARLETTRALISFGAFEQLKTQKGKKKFVNLWMFLRKSSHLTLDLPLTTLDYAVGSSTTLLYTQQHI